MATSFHKVNNNAESVLASAIDDNDLSAAVQTGDGAEFDTAKQYLTIGRTVNTPGEVVDVTSRSSDTFTIATRGVDGTSATSHEAGDAVECLLVAAHIDEIQDAINAIENGTTTLSSVALPDIGSDPVGLLKFGNSDDFYWGYDGTLDFLGLYEGVGGKPMIIINSLVSGNGAPFTFAVGDDWSAWEADNSLTFPDNLNNWHFYSSNNTVAVMEIESRGETVVSIEANSDNAGTAAGYILYQSGATNHWSAGLKNSDSNAYVIGTGANLGTPVLHLNKTSYLATFSGSIDAKDFYNDDATPTLANPLSATVGGVMVAPNKNVATLTAAGNTSARVHLNDIGGTSNQRIMEITMDGATSAWVRRTDAGTSTTMLSFDHSTSNATFAGDVTVNGGDISIVGNTANAILTTDASTSSFSTGMVVSIGGTAQFRLGTVGGTSNTWKLRDAVTSTSVYEVTRATPNVMTMTARFLVRQVTDAGPMTATAGTVGEIVYNLSDNKSYTCTATGSPATWAAHF